MINRVNHRVQVENLLDEWVGTEQQSMNIINCLVQFLISDPQWLSKNVSNVDRQLLVVIGRYLEAKV